jgi:hypothetical protein
MTGIHFVKVLPSCLKRCSAISHELHKPPKIAHGEVELAKTSSHLLSLFSRGSHICLRERHQYLGGPPIGAKSL